MTLPDWREERPAFPRGLSWGVAEAVVCRTGPRPAPLLITSQGVPEPGQKKWPPGAPPLEVSLIDVAAKPVERPHTNSGATPAEESTISLFRELGDMVALSDRSMVCTGAERGKVTAPRMGLQGSPNPTCHEHRQQRDDNQQA